MERLSLIAVNKGKPCSEDEARRRQAADGFRIGQEVCIKSKKLDWLSPAEGKELVAYKILRTEKRADMTPWHSINFSVLFPVSTHETN